MVEIRVNFYVEYRPMLDCCMEAVYSAFTDAYPKADICLPGIDSNQYFFITFVLNIRDIASYCSKKKAYVLTSNSDFLVYNIPGVVLLPDRLFKDDLYMYHRSDILKCLRLTEFQLYDFVMISGNDFTENQAVKLSDGRLVRAPINLYAFQKMCKSKREWEEDYEERFPNNNVMDEFEKVKKYYSCEQQVEAPWNCLTTDIESLDEIKMKVSEGLALRMISDFLENLITINEELRRFYQKYARKYIFSMHIGMPMIQSVEFEEQRRE